MIKFSKAHAYGNDFLYVDKADVPSVRLDALARILCDRHAGVGADGLIVYEAAGLDVTMRLFNADGSRAEVSGNGVRGLGALVLRHDTGPHRSVRIHTEGGTKEVTRISQKENRQTFRASMGVPDGLREATVQVGGESIKVVVLNMGNPQCVIIGPLPDEARFRQLGAPLERHPMFPEGTNVEFACVESPTVVRILIWERGVGPTTSSGTGSCAALVAAAAFGGAAREADVMAPGGPQRVEWASDGVYLTGWAEVIADGQWLGQIPRTAG